jgi:hypothetical protein
VFLQDTVHNDLKGCLGFLNWPDSAFTLILVDLHIFLLSSHVVLSTYD